MARSPYHLRVPRFDSIRSRILALAVLGALVPTTLALGFAYVQNRRSLETLVTQNLLSATAQAARATGVWVKEHLYDLRVFASDDDVFANANRYAMGQGSIPSARLREYLRALQEKSPNFDELVVLDTAGRVIASGTQRTSAVDLPPGWQQTLRADNQLIGRTARDERSAERSLLVAVPISRADGQLIGAFAARIPITPLQAVLREFAPAGSATLSLVNTAGVVLATSGALSPGETTTMPATELARLRDREHQAIPIRSASGEDVIASLDRVPQLSWVVVAELQADEAFAAVRRFRVVAILAVLALVTLVTWVAYRLGQVIVRPLERLAAGATVVAAGDLDVDLPQTGEAGEVDALTVVFNNMVRRLRTGRQQLGSLNETLRAKALDLERLSVTDSLTGLVNHRLLMQRLQDESLRAKRTERPFGVIMADVDWFKKYNDEFGHPAGDEVLKQVAKVLQEATRSVDCVARYGGEEFALILPETTAEGAMEVAERIRARVAGTQFAGGEITLSLGVAEFPADADTAPKVLAVADKALYEAKRSGRNCVRRAKPSVRKTRAIVAPRLSTSAAKPRVTTKKKR